MIYDIQKDLIKFRLELAQTHEQREAADERIEQLRIIINTLMQIEELEKKTNSPGGLQKS